MRQALVLVLVVTAGLAAALPAAAHRAGCSVPFKGPAWVANGQHGTTYTLDASGVTCSYALPWARKLAALKNTKPFYPVRGGPAGWVCNAMASSPKITSGACVKGTKRFGWRGSS